VVMQSCASSKAVSGMCHVRHFIVRQSGVAGCQCRYRSDDLQLRPNVQSAERTKAVTSFYFQPAIDQASAKVSEGLSSRDVRNRYFLKFRFGFEKNSDFVWWNMF